ncbi:unnamed protein product [Sphagnum troendelagicum]|uniref:Uncharacterized protein n=1 Tax=Sphagnum troendelagicum TaxID=128251 RepID=A0ABP0UV07_9BRYO
MGQVRLEFLHLPPPIGESNHRPERQVSQTDESMGPSGSPPKISYALSPLTHRLYGGTPPREVANIYVVGHRLRDLSRHRSDQYYVMSQNRSLLMAQTRAPH